MKPDELRRALDDIAGEPPIADDAFRVVRRRVRPRQVRARAGVVAVCAVVMAGATVGAVQLRSSDHHVLVVHPSQTGPTDVAGLTWTRVSAAQMTINRMVTADGHTFAVGSTPNGGAAIAEVEAGGVSSTVDPTLGYDVPARSGAVNDLVEIPGALIAVGQSAETGAAHADAWRSTDGGRTWHSVRVEVPEGPGNHTMTRVVASNGVVYAFGSSFNAVPTTSIGCGFASVWTSSDGLDFRLIPGGPPDCGGATDAADGPGGVLVTTSDNAVAWNRDGASWSSHRMWTSEGSRVLAVAGDDQSYVAVGSTTDHAGITTAAIWWSTDGIAWSRVATDSAPPDPTYQQAQFTAVAHAAGGWIAVGWKLHAGGNPAVTDAILRTSPDGQHWTQVQRDGNAFEQYARADGIGATSDGFAIFGLANITGNGVPGTGDPIRRDDVLWIGSTTPASTDGIIEGSMREIGGRAPGLDRGIAGSMNVTYPGGRTITTPIPAGGRFSFRAAPGSYTIVGHSPPFGNGTYDCPAAGTVRVTANNVAHVELVCSID